MQELLHKLMRGNKGAEQELSTIKLTDERSQKLDQQDKAVELRYKIINTLMSRNAKILFTYGPLSPIRYLYPSAFNFVPRSNSRFSERIFALEKRV